MKLSHLTMCKAVALFSVDQGKPKR